MNQPSKLYVSSTSASTTGIRSHDELRTEANMIASVNPFATDAVSRTKLYGAANEWLGKKPRRPFGFR